MPAKSKSPPRKQRKTRTKDPVQSARFLEMAKEVEADESGEAFSRALSAVLPRKKKP